MMFPLEDLHGNIPTFISITDGKTHDVKVLDGIMPEAGGFTSCTAAGWIFESICFCTLRAAFVVVRTKNPT